ncbi:MAG TPA: ABC-F family ATP-binding cassette domain-containing protein [Pseudomonadota bacterium]|nr:ABC-F family ATP-binding cassette domain-containing protein [Pseudomonadota bacterium]
MITLQNLGKSYGARSLFSDVSLRLSSGARYGLVGANGSGKTTLLNMLAGDEAASEGLIQRLPNARIGVLRQDRFLDDAEIILEVAAKGDRLVWGALCEQRRLSEEGGDATRIADLEETIRAHDGYTLEARASFILEGLGIPVVYHRQPLATLSGGFKLRVLLAQVLLGGPDLVLLDEPTNHLDILSIRWLEKFLAAYKGCAVIISHDQRFLDNVATHILDIDYDTITAYPGNYSAFEAQKRDVRVRKEIEIAQAEAAIAHKRAYVERFRYKASKASQAQSRLKQIEKIEVEELVETSRRAPSFRFTPDRPSGRDVLTIDGVSKSYGEKRVLRDVSLVVRRGEKLAIIGPNGLGKSTLLKIALSRVTADAGEVRWGHEARVGYFAQDHREVLTDPEVTALDFLWAARPQESTAFVRGHLGRVLFSGDDVTKKAGLLSGGEAARLIFGRLMAEGPNVLVLDEPTNHLDIEAIHALLDALVAFEGTVIFVSHDRFFVSGLATRILEITPGGPRDFPGTYQEYLSRCGDDHLDSDSVVLKAKKERKEEQAATPPAGPPPGRIAWEEQKRRSNRKKDLPQRRDKALAAVEQAEARKRAIHDLYASPGFYERTSPTEVEALVAEEASLGPKIEALISEWEALESELAALESE